MLNSGRRIYSTNAIVLEGTSTSLKLQLNNSTIQNYVISTGSMSRTALKKPQNAKRSQEQPRAAVVIS